MAKFRKRPIVVEADPFDPDRRPWPPGVYGVRNGGARDDEAPHYWQIDTLDGPLAVVAGDVIITGIKGERYPCKPDIFAATYEPVE
jgi:hypothetical protein